MVSALDSRLASLGLSTDRDTVLCSWERHFSFMVQCTSLHPGV